MSERRWHIELFANAGQLHTEITCESATRAGAKAKIRRHFHGVDVQFLSVECFDDLEKTDKHYMHTAPCGRVKLIHLESDLPTTEEENKKQIRASYGPGKIERIWR